MTAAPPPNSSRYFTNRLYENNFFFSMLPESAQDYPEQRELYEKIRALYEGKNLLSMNEAQLEDSVIKPVLLLLGWSPLYQEEKTFHGVLEKPDWTLFASEAAEDAYCIRSRSARRENFDGIVSFCESKAAAKALDTGKAGKMENPYRQILHYLTYARLSFGFLTNGLEWWLVDNRAISSEKKYLRVCLADILRDGDYEAFSVFARLFARAAHVPQTDDAETEFEEISRKEKDARLAVENDLRKVIYGTDGKDSLFERIGEALFATTNRDASPENLRLVFENSLYLVFRFLFIAYFEDRYGSLLQGHPYYACSLHKIHEDLKQDRQPDSFTGWNALQTLFRTLGEGNANLGVPLLNGGLFDDSRASLLNRFRIMDNAALADVLDALFLFRPEENRPALLRRDFRSLSVTHLGAIYEGLLEFEFRVAEEKLAYVTYSLKEKGKTKIYEGFFDSYDIARLAGLKAAILKERPLAKGSFYLVSRQNSRKASGSYYTPSSLSLPLVRRAIDLHLPRLKSVMELRILDNACGSGHLLVEALNHLTRRALERIDTDAALADSLEEEKKRIAATREELALFSGARPPEVDEADIVKRLLLKTVIYGVDIQPFAVELAHLSLWIDSFVFGTPLSFIEHHVKSGNSLIGATKKEFDAFLTEGGSLSLFTMDLNEKFARLHEVCLRLNAIQDTTKKDIDRSKELYRSQIKPLLEEMNLCLNLLNTRDMMRCEGGEKEAQKLTESGAVRELAAGRNNALAVQIGQYRRRYGFFNWEVEFPEAFFGRAKGFHIIIGNPPWDKTKFEDPLFFSRYRSNYRSLPESKKRELALDLLAKPSVSERYEEEKLRARAVNAYYRKQYPHNAGAGDGNLFRFFVEKNLELLAPEGSLNYVLPTALLTEDGSASLRGHIFAQYSITAFDGFENRKKLFPEVHASYKFGLLQIVRRIDPGQKAATRFMLTDPDALSSESGVFLYGLEDVRAISPQYMAYLEARDGERDLGILRRLYPRFPALSPDWLDFRNELHATADKSLFHEVRQPGSLPLYKGDMIWQYDSLFGQEEYRLDPEAFDARLQQREISRLIDDVYPDLAAPAKQTKERAVLDVLDLKERAELGRFVRPDRHFYRLAFRDVASDTNERTLIAALLPPGLGAQHTLWMSIPKRYGLDAADKTVVVTETPLPRLLFAQALFSSLVVDWILRFSAAIHVTKSLLTRLPLPQPGDAELRDNPAYAELCRNSLRLSLRHNKSGFKALQKGFGLTDRDIPSTDKQADMLRIRNDHLVARIYGLSEEEFAHVLSGFPVLRKKRPEYALAVLSGYCADGEGAPLEKSP